MLTPLTLLLLRNPLQDLPLQPGLLLLKFLQDQTLLYPLITTLSSLPLVLPFPLLSRSSTFPPPPTAQRSGGTTLHPASEPPCLRRSLSLLTVG